MMADDQCAESSRQTDSSVVTDWFGSHDEDEEESDGDDGDDPGQDYWGDEDENDPDVSDWDDDEDDEEQYKADEGEDEEDEEEDSDIPEPAPKARKKQQTPKENVKRRRRVAEPESDNDPEPPIAHAWDYPSDDHGWTRSLQSVMVRLFKDKKPLGACFKRSSSALKYFLEFFPLNLFLLIVKWTNMKIRAAGKKATNVAEIRAWFGLHILMGLIKQANFRNYWSTHPALRNNLISATMARNRFNVLNTFLACNDPDKDPSYFDKAHQYRYKKRHPLYPLEPIWECVRQQCLHKYNPGKNLTIDEAMIKYRGFKASVKKFFMPLKPIRAGFKVYVLAEINNWRYT